MVLAAKNTSSAPESAEPMRKALMGDIESRSSCEVIPDSETTVVSGPKIGARSRAF